MKKRMLGMLQPLYYRLNVSRALNSAQRSLSVPDGDYRNYLREQLEETLRKKQLSGRKVLDVVPLVDILASHHDFTGQSVLCVGCRNTDELHYFKKRGAGRVVGIDLYSDTPEIQVMDMHDLKFSDGSFDVVYSRHSFEHAYDKAKAGGEFVRVLKDRGVVIIEVPGNYKGGADYNRFDGIDDVTGAFGDRIGGYHLREYSRKEDNPYKMDIIRVVFWVDKQTVAAVLN